MGSPNHEGDTSQQQETRNGGNQDENGIELTEKEALIQSLGRDFSQYTYDGNFVVYIKFVKNREEVEQDIREGAHFPDFVHQFFVSKELIFGYKQPIIRLFYTAGRLKRYIKFDYEARLEREKDGIDADDVMDCLSPIMNDIEYTQDLNQFIKEASSDEELHFKPPGELLHEFESEFRKMRHLSRAQRELLEEAGEMDFKIGRVESNGNASDSIAVASSSSLSQLGEEDVKPTTKQYQIFHANASTKNFNQFQARMQTLVMWFIESANMIDFEDSRWDCFMIFEKYNPSTSEGTETTPISSEDRYFFAGYATVYRYYAYPDRTRPRVSQMLILPQYRRNGLGTRLLQSIYDFYKKQPSTLDITAEDPDEEFISMRDLLDCKNCLQLNSFKNEKLREGWSDEMTKEAQEKLKLCPRQTRKVYEILKLRTVSKSDVEEYKKYRLEIKNRLNIPNRKQKKGVDRATYRYKNIVVPDELKQQENVIAAKLEDNYRLLEKQYQHVVSKLNRPKIVAA